MPDAVLQAQDNKSLCAATNGACDLIRYVVPAESGVTLDALYKLLHACAVDAGEIRKIHGLRSREYANATAIIMKIVDLISPLIPALNPEFPMETERLGGIGPLPNARGN